MITPSGTSGDTRRCGVVSVCVFAGRSAYERQTGRSCDAQRERRRDRAAGNPREACTCRLERDLAADARRQQQPDAAQILACNEPETDRLVCGVVTANIVRMKKSAAAIRER